MLGEHIQFSGHKKLTEEMQDYALLLASNFTEEILNSHAAGRLSAVWKGIYLISIPCVNII
jgi:hypothetical protein